jgi:hypothetical protein
MQRTFDRRIYTLNTSHEVNKYKTSAKAKTYATQDAKAIRAKGYGARVTKEPSGAYYVWMSTSMFRKGKMKPKARARRRRSPRTRS